MHYPVRQGYLLCTDLTPGKQMMVLVCQRKAVNIAVRGIRGRSRWSKLKEWVAGANQ